MLSLHRAPRELRNVVLLALVMASLTAVTAQLQKQSQPAPVPGNVTIPPSMNVTTRGGVNQLETPRLSERDQRTEFPLAGPASAFKFGFSDVNGPARVNNSAALQLQVDKVGNQFLSTLLYPGTAQFLTALKPCGILLPHVHQRATELNSVIFGTMSAGIAQENGALQNITFPVNAGEVFIAPQGLLHFNHNQQCNATVFFQTFNSADPGALTVTNALAALGAPGPNGTAAIPATGVSPLGAFALDAACLAKCQLPPSGAPGDGLGGLPPAIRTLFGLVPQTTTLGSRP